MIKPGKRNKPSVTYLDKVLAESSQVSLRTAADTRRWVMKYPWVGGALKRGHSIRTIRNWKSIPPGDQEQALRDLKKIPPGKLWEVHPGIDITSIPMTDSFTNHVPRMVQLCPVCGKLFRHVERSFIGSCSFTCEKVIVRNRRTKRKQVPQVKRCAYCDEEFTPKRSDAKYCGNACKVAWHRSLQ